jgi:c-di-GMP-binding flagellar brake protein YcgR
MWWNGLVQGQLGIGQSAEILVDGAEPEIALQAFVYGMPPGELLFTFPTVKVLPPHLEIGRAVTVRFFSGGGAHHARSQVLRVSTTPHVTAALSSLTKVETIQRRRYFRVSATLPVTFEVTRSAVADAAGKSETRGLSQDVSAGGIRLETSVLLTIDDRIRLILTTPRAFQKALPPTMEATARVVRVHEGNRKANRPYSLSVELLFEAESERDRWVQLTFDLQRGAKF